MKINKKVALSGLLLCCAITAKAQVCITPQAEQRARELVSQMTLEEKIDYISGPKSFYIRAVPRLGIPEIRMADGPQGIRNNTQSTLYPCGILSASTWNRKLARELGHGLARDAKARGVSILLGPGVNIYRSPLCGRNYEYFGEDPYLMGETAKEYILGVQEEGVMATVKHFAANNKETNRKDSDSRVSERALREIYLKPFEICVKEGKAKAVMSSFNYIGTRWAGGSEELCNTVLRDEWGFQGFVLTDYFGVYGYMNSDQGIRNGTDAMLVAYDTETNHVKDQNSATGVEAMRQACKNIMYTVVNSRAYDAENLETGLMTWQIAAIAADVVLGVGILALEIVAIKRFRKRLAEEKAAVAVEN